MSDPEKGEPQYSVGGYKRAARLLFVSTGPTRALAAAALARRHARWFEARAAALRPGPPAARARTVLRAAGIVLPRCRVSRVSQASLAWADVVLTLDEPARSRVVALDSGRPVRHVAASRDDWADWCGLLEQRLAGMAGGLRMMARLR